MKQIRTSMRLIADERQLQPSFHLGYRNYMDKVFWKELNMRNIENRLAALEKQSGTGQTIIVWRDDDDAIYEKRLAEAEAKRGHFDTIMRVAEASRPMTSGSNDGFDKFPC